MKVCDLCDTNLHALSFIKFPLPSLFSYGTSLHPMAFQPGGNSLTYSKVPILMSFLYSVTSDSSHCFNLGDLVASFHNFMSLE